MTKEIDYPSWVCYDCARNAGYVCQGMQMQLSTYHMGICDVCNEEKALSEPRNYGYPRFRKKS